MVSKKTVVVFGATGAQGGSVVDYLLSNPAVGSKYTVRAVTRDPKKPAAQQLAKRGAEVVQADLSSPATLPAALKDAHAVFAVTNFFELSGGAQETEQGKAVVDAAVKAGVKHFIWSGLPDAKAVSGGALTHVDHFESKARVTEHLLQVKGSMWTTVVMMGFYQENYRNFIHNIHGTWTMPTVMNLDTKVAALDVVRDAGAYVAGVLEAGEKADGVSLLAVSEWNTVQDVTAAFQQVTGTKIEYLHVPHEAFAGSLVDIFGQAIAEDLTEMTELFRDFEFNGPGSQQKQAEWDRFLPSGYKKTTLREFIKNNGPWFQAPAVAGAEEDEDEDGDIH